MKTKAMIAGAIAVACAIDAVAADTRDYSTYIKLKADTDLTAEVGGWPAANKWNPEGEMTDEGYYLIPSGKTLMSRTNTAYTNKNGVVYQPGGTWPMAEMAIQGTFSVTASGGRNRAAVTPRLAFLPGGKIAVTSAYGTIKGDTLDIRGTAANPSLITYNYATSNDKSSYYALLDIAFTGDADGVVKFSYTGTGENYSIFQRAFRVTNGFANFLGTVIVDGANTWLRPQTSSTTFDIGGTLWVTNGANVYIDTVSPTFGSLVLASNATLRLAGQKFVTVTNFFSMAEGAKIQVDSIATTAFTYDTGDGYSPPEIPVLSVCGAANAAAVDRDALMATIKANSGVFKNTISDDVPRLVLVESARADGGVDFKISHTPVVKQLKGCGSGTGPYGNNQYEGFLSDGQEISPDKDYYVPQLSVYFGSPYTFPGRSLTIYLAAGGRNIGFYSGDDITIPDLRIIGENVNSRFRQMAKDGGAKLRGNAAFYGFSNFRVQGSGVFRLMSALSGDGIICETLDIEKIKERGSAWLGTLSVEGDNTNFAGKFFVGCGRAASDAEGLTNLTLRVASAASLGGACEAFTFDAVKIADACTLDITNTATFNAVNRGWCLMDGATVKISDNKVVTMNEAITFGGTSEKPVEKAGNGTLLLGGSAKFYDSENDEATDTPNGAAFRVAAGNLGVMSGEALYGVDLTFAADTKLLVFPGTEGLSLTAAPRLDGGTLAVKFENPDDVAAGTLNILTLPSSVPFDTTKLTVIGKKGFRVRPVEARTDGDRTVYCASFSKIGFSLTIW